MLTKLANINSDQAFIAQISFNDNLTINQIIELVNKHNLSPVTLNIGSGEHDRHHDLRTDETIESATMRA